MPSHTPKQDLTAILKWICLLPLLMAAGPGYPVSSASSLARIDLPDQQAVEKFARLGLPILADFPGPAGVWTLIMTLEAPDLRRLQQLGAPARILAPVVERDRLYLADLRDLEAPGWLPGVVYLPDLGDHLAILTGRADEIDRLVARGVAVRKLTPYRLLPTEGRTPAQEYVLDSPDPLIQAMLSQVTTGRIHDLVGDLSGEWPVTVQGSAYTFKTRYSYVPTAVLNAATFTGGLFRNMGLPVDYDYFTLRGAGQLRNVLAEQKGVLHPQRVVMLIGHLDDTSNNPYQLAPGADDNASGVAGVLIAAEIMSQYHFGCTLRYGLFTGEEQGQIGSQAYTRDAAARGEQIEAVLNLDMIGYDGDGHPEAELHIRNGQAGDRAIADLLVDVVQVYGLDLAPVILSDGLSFSDHASFWIRGYPAVLAIEDWDGDRTPRYHQTGDRLGTLDLDYAASYIRAAVGTIAHLGCGIYPHRAFLPLAQNQN